MHPRFGSRAIAVTAATLACFPVAAYAHGPKELAAVLAIGCCFVGFTTGPVIGAIAGVLKFGRLGRRRCLLFTSLLIIAVSLAISVTLFLFSCVVGYSGKLLSLPGCLGGGAGTSTHWPDWIDRMAGGAFFVVAVVVASLPLVLLVYLWTLSYVWLLAVFLRTRPHVVWMSPVLSTVALCFAAAILSTGDQGLVLTWMHTVILACCFVCYLVGAYLAGLSVASCARLANALMTWRSSRTPPASPCT